MDMKQVSSSLLMAYVKWFWCSLQGFDQKAIYQQKIYGRYVLWRASYIFVSFLCQMTLYPHLCVLYGDSNATVLRSIQFSFRTLVGKRSFIMNFRIRTAIGTMTRVLRVISEQTSNQWRKVDISIMIIQIILTKP